MKSREIKIKDSITGEEKSATKMERITKPGAPKRFKIEEKMYGGFKAKYL